MIFKYLDECINLPKDINYTIYEYSNNICMDCNNELDYCDDCEFYYCYCDDISECYICKKIFCQLIHDLFYQVGSNRNLLLCNVAYP